jgi:signal transduction histidine kinase
MYDALKDAIFFTIPYIAALSLSVMLFYGFFRERSRRKLMFAIGILCVAFGHAHAMMTSLGYTPIFATTDWLYVPISLAVAVAALSSFLRLKDFKTPFGVFLSGTAASFIIFFTQLPLETLRLGLTTSLLSIAIPTLLYLFIKSRESADLIFLLATLCFIFQGLTVEVGTQIEITVLLSLFSVVFTGLMFIVPNNGNAFSMASFLTLEKQLHRAKEDLQKAQEKLLKAERLAAIGELAGMVGHDLRNPMQGIAGAAYYLKAKKSAILDDKGREMVETIETCIQRSNKIINDLLEYSREINLDIEETNAQALVDNALCQIQVPASIKVVNQASDEPNLQVDKEKIERVFMNIVKNAVDAMPNGGNLTVESENTKDKIAVKFNDTGTGMKEEVMRKIWTPLFTTKAKGMGFGLAICKRIIEAHGGEIRAESASGQGSVFTVTLPLKTQKPEKQTDYAALQT